MKKKLRYMVYDKEVEREINYIPVRFIIAVMLALLATLAVMAIVVLLSLYVPYFYLLMWATEIACVIQIASSNENPDYKVPWLLVVLVVPVAGLMLYIMFIHKFVCFVLLEIWACFNLVYLRYNFIIHYQVN